MLEAAGRGLGLIDLGATTSLVGMKEAGALQETLEKAHGRRSTVDHQRRRTFTFGNGEQERTRGVAGLLVRLGGKSGRLEVHLLDKPAPLLIGIDLLTRHGAIIDCESGTIRFKNLDNQVRPLKRLPSGHLCLALDE